uniref:Serine/threonine-protein kinase BSK1-like TPR repeats domain-containing protein n=1 Tax=Oryza brachyantha TaxID=4533 RepID=J3NFA8_ORYBR
MAAFLLSAYHGDVRNIKRKAKVLDEDGKGIEATVANTSFLGMNALHALSWLGKVPAYQYFVEEVKMDVTKPDTIQGYTPLEHAVSNGRLPAIRYLLGHGADLHQVRSKGNVTLLHAAAVKGYSEVVRFLLSRGVDVNAESVMGTPLTLATYRGYDSTVKILLEHNADPNKESNSLFGAPLDMALTCSSVSCVKLLVQAGADVKVEGPHNHSVRAAEKGLTEAIKCFLEAGATPTVPDMFGRMPIELAAEYGTEDVEILFPFSSAIPTVANWSVDGIINHVQSEIKQLEDDKFVKKRKSDLKQQGDAAFKKQDYLNASVFYTQALKVDKFDGTLFSNRSLCWLRMGDGQRALDDANACKRLRPKWAKSHYRQGAALMFLKDYDKASTALSQALELDPESEEIENLYCEVYLWVRYYKILGTLEVACIFSGCCFAPWSVWNCGVDSCMPNYREKLTQNWEPLWCYERWMDAAQTRLFAAFVYIEYLGG